MKRELSLSGAARRLAALLIRNKKTFASAESCTGGMVASAAVGVQVFAAASAARTFRMPQP